ncbi:MAG TPA: hypothetical protein PLC27_04085 [Saprospiraceae bacterium]|nr:hypothetical protein [Saprospiraceae bacterium]
MMVIVFFIMMVGMMIAFNKTDQLKRDKLKILEYKDSLNIKVNNLSVYNGVFEINYKYNLNGPYYKKGSKSSYTEFANRNLDSIIKYKNSNEFKFIFKNQHRDTVFLIKEKKDKGYFNF